MAKRHGNLPQLSATRVQGVRSYIAPTALSRWDPGIRAAASDDENTISILDPIGMDPWTGEGVTAKRIRNALRSIGGEDVTVVINSPGGDMFEGIAIYNLFREYDGKITMQVLGMAASAASFIAMAGDEVQVARSAFFMIHNAWALAIGNRHDFQKVADDFAKFDGAMAEIYALRTEQLQTDIAAMMDAETWLGGTEAIEEGFADNYLPSDQIQHDTQSEDAAALRADLALAQTGFSRSERRALIRELRNGKSSAADDDMLRAVSADLEPLQFDVPTLETF